MASVGAQGRAALIRHRGLAAWAAASAALLVLLILLTLGVSDDAFSSADRKIMDRVSGWSVPGLAGFSERVIDMTGNWPALGLGVTLIGLLWFVGMTRDAWAFIVVGGAVGLVALLADFVIGSVVGRPWPGSESLGYSFPSGHALGSTIFLGFWGFVMLRSGLKRRYVLSALFALGVVIAAAGFGLVYLRVHWPTDVAAGYLLGGLWLLVLVPAFLYLRRARWFFSPWAEHLHDAECEPARLEQSIASAVLLDLDQGTATKIYCPPAVVRLLYWVAFQAPFPYEHAATALQTAEYRRKIASHLTTYRFGKDLVSPVLRLSWVEGRRAMVTEFVDGSPAPNDEVARRFLTDVAGIFSEAGLAVWQVNPRNPHAHTNLIRSAEGEHKIIDLESALVTLFPPRGQWLWAMRSGLFPVFDDMNFERMRRFLAMHHGDLLERLGPDGMMELTDAVTKAERLQRLWKESEPRLWGRILRWLYRAVAWSTLTSGLARLRKKTLAHGASIHAGEPPAKGEPPIDPEKWWG